MTPISPSPEKNPISTAPAPKPDAAAATREPSSPPQRGSGFRIILLLATVVLLFLVYFFGIAPRISAGKALTREEKISTQRIVIFAVAQLAVTKTELPLPGTIEAFQQASLNARTNGYVKRWMVDIGDRVREGDVLAELDTPEVDQQLIQARATAEQAQASLAIAQITAKRWDSLVGQHAVSQQEADDKKATSSVAQAALDAAQAEVARLTDLQNFKQIRAPFSGTVTYRNIEKGNLITSGTGAANSELFRIAQIDPLRVFIDVPESATRSIQPGVEAKLHVAAYPNRIFAGQVVRDAGAVDTTTRTLRTEVRVANPDGALLPGTFAEVRLQLVNEDPAVLIPANALIVNSGGTSVALVEKDDNDRDKIRYVPVTVGRDFGTQVEILKNVKNGDRLVTNPPADLNDGTVVTAQPLPAPPAVTPPPSPAPPKA